MLEDSHMSATGFSMGFASHFVLLHRKYVRFSPQRLTEANTANAEDVTPMAPVHLRDCKQGFPSKLGVGGGGKSEGMVVV